MYRHIRSVGIDPRTDVGMEFARLAIRYITGACGAFDFQRNAKPYLKNTDVSAKVFRLRLVEDGYIITRFKFAAISMCFLPVTTSSVNKVREDFELERNDAVLLRKAFRTRKWRSELKATPRIGELSADKYSREGLDRYTADLEDITKEIVPHIRQLTHRKLRFLVNSENMEYGDFHNELQCKAVMAYYTEVPSVKSKAHLTNTLRTACNNYCNNIIDAWTSKKRQRMTNDGDDGFGGYKFGMNVVSENQIMASVDGSLVTFEELAGEDDNARQSFNALNYRKVVMKLGKTPLRRKLIETMSGEFCPKFTDYLQVTGKIRGDKDNTDFIETASQGSILDAVSEYYNVEKIRLSRFFAHVGGELRQGRYS